MFSTALDMPPFYFSFGISSGALFLLAGKASGPPASILTFPFSLILVVSSSSRHAVIAPLCNFFLGRFFFFGCVSSSSRCAFFLICVFSSVRHALLAPLCNFFLGRFFFLGSLFSLSCCAFVLNCVFSSARHALLAPLCNFFLGCVFSSARCAPRVFFSPHPFYVQSLLPFVGNIG